MALLLAQDVLETGKGQCWSGLLSLGEGVIKGDQDPKGKEPHVQRAVSSSYPSSYHYIPESGAGRPRLDAPIFVK